ncbi:MAG TPA: DUF2064 domain-containing protein [Eudoraea sp.]|nr:DUF2064 domain-containing protein [Eudoraea sp.]
MEIRNDHKTAILVFANSPEQELQNKPMVKAEAFFEMLTEQTLKMVRETGIPYFHYTERQQCGNSFGERFVNGLQSIFEKGYENVIAIGNDTPHLKKADLIGAFESLKKGKFVVGPSADGGFYLLGLHRSNFNASEFLGLPWQNSHLGKALLHVASGFGKEVVRLKTLFDLDTFGELSLFVSRFKNIGVSLFRFIVLLITNDQRCPQQVVGAYSLLGSENCYNKGSPSSGQVALA